MLIRLRQTVAIVSTLALWAVGGTLAAAPPASIDRHALVSRHNPKITKVDPWAPLSVGNGRFAFTVDVTGLQSFADHYQKAGIPLETLARWSWHSNPNPNGYTLADANVPFTANGKTVDYPANERNAAGRWLRENPHDMPLPQLALARIDGAPIRPADLHDIVQTLDLWTGTLTSSFSFDDSAVEVTVAAHPLRDVLAVRIESPLVGRGRLGVRLALPRGHDITVKNNPGLDWSLPESHSTQLASQSEKTLVLEHTRDAAHYITAVTSAATLRIEREGPHRFHFRPAAGNVLEFTVSFAPEKPEPATTADAVRAASGAHWPAFWQSGGAIDFSGSKDPRAAELERRVVLSQYLTAIQFAGDFPPQESGLTNSTWFGKHHTEMVWWHTAHFALWGREALLAKNLDWFVGALPIARELAKSRALQGARWAKMIGPDGRESPGGNPLIVWNQPHPIHLAELIYRNAPTPATLARYKDLVLDSAACMASMLNWDEAKQRYNLGPPLWNAQEIYDRATSTNPTYELSYWVRGLTIAQAWRERLHLGRDAEWDKRIQRIAPLPIRDGKYVALESTPDTWENKDSRHDHPSFLMALGQLPGDGVDRPTMRRTLDAVITSWDWEAKIWGWDYPMIAMTAARLGEPQKAVDILLFSKGPNNAYTANGHCPQRGDLPVYLPGQRCAARRRRDDGGRLGRCTRSPRSWLSQRWLVDGEERRSPAFAVVHPPAGRADARWNSRENRIRQRAALTASAISDRWSARCAQPNAGGSGKVMRKHHRGVCPITWLRNAHPVPFSIMTLAEAAADFLAQRRIAVVGVSRRHGHVTRFIFKKLRTADREVVPVNPAANEIDGVRCYPDLRSIPGGVQAVLVVTRPTAAAEVVRECAALGITRVWLHRSVGAGSASEEAVRVARESKLTLIPSGCPMMFCAPVDLGHKCIRWCLRITGRLPATVEA